MKGLISFSKIFHGVCDSFLSFFLFFLFAKESKFKTAVCDMLLWSPEGPSFCWLSWMMSHTPTNLTTDFLMKPLLPCSICGFKCTCMVPWLGLLLAFPEPQRTWPSLVLSGTFPLMKCTFCRRAWLSLVPWLSLNGNFPFFHASLPVSLSAPATLVCVTHVLCGQGMFDS